MPEVDFFSEVEVKDADVDVLLSDLLAQEAIPFNVGDDVPATASEVSSNEQPQMESGNTNNGSATVPGSVPGNVGEPGKSQVTTEAGIVIDPDTGEVLERPYVLQRLKWTEIPVLPENATSEEREAFLQKLDQIVDIICTYEDRVTRYTAAHDYRIAKLEGAKEFWERIAEPLARQLGNQTLKRYRSGEKKGQFSEKSLHLPSGTISFRVKGGWSIHDFNEVKHYVKSFPREYHSRFFAHDTVSIDYKKFASALAKQQYKYLQIPGTQYVPPDPLGTIKVKSPKGKDKEDEANNE